MISLSACSGGGSSSQTSSDGDNFTEDTCYNQCEEWGGGDENVAMCKENCDASFDESSVWNDDEEQYNEDITKAEWPSDMPEVVPSFSYGKISGAETGMGSWIVDFEDVTDDALSNYTQDLKDAGWNASAIELTGMITGSYDNGNEAEDYTVNVNMDREMKVAQIMIRKKK